MGNRKSPDLAGTWPLLDAEPGWVHARVVLLNEDRTELLDGR
jgi:hypothetical protein